MVQNVLVKQAANSSNSGKLPTCNLTAVTGQIAVRRNEVVIAGESETTIYKNAVEECNPSFLGIR